VWDSLAIAEYANETFAGGALWPEVAAARAQARAASAEMHSGFPALRGQMPMNCRATGRVVPMTPELAQDIDRVRTLWRECRERFAGAGPWLFGRFSIADAMYAPVASRFRTYGVTLDDPEAAYLVHLLADADVRHWFAAAAEEPEVIAAEELGG
jgi:glutathione S-transferase